MKHRFVPLVLALGLAAGCRSGGESPKPAQQPVTNPTTKPAKAAQVAPQPVQAAQPAQSDARADRLAKLQKEFDEASQAYQKAFQQALGDNKNPTADDLKKIQETVKEPDAKSYLARGQQLLDEGAKDITAFKTIQWMMRNADDTETKQTLRGLLERYHMDRPEMAELCSQLAQDDRDLLDKLARTSPHQEVRGRATYSQADALKSDIQTAGFVSGKTPEELERMKGWLGAERLAKLQVLDLEKTQAQIEQIYERVLKEYPDVVLNKGSKRETTLGKQASAGLFEIRNLAVGKTTPEIEGSDLDSVAFKLSDYRGKVVLLDFWGNW
jgi:hypothetical protein